MEKIMKNALLLLLVLLTVGCSAMKYLPFSEDSKNYQAAKLYFEQGRYDASHDAYRAIASSRSPWAEEAHFHAASVLLYHANTRKSYTSAEGELEEFLAKYPKSSFVDEASTWLALLKMFHQTNVGILSKEVEQLTVKSERLTKDLQKTRTESDALRNERDLIFMERNALVKRVDELLGEKEALIRKNEELVKDNLGLVKDKKVLTKNVDSLRKEKKTLLEAKAALEKSLHDLTMVDVKMERKRSKIKADEKK